MIRQKRIAAKADAYHLKTILPLIHENTLVVERAVVTVPVLASIVSDNLQCCSGLVYSTVHGCCINNELHLYCGQTGRQAGRQAGRQTTRQAGEKASRQGSSQTEDMQEGRQADRLTEDICMQASN